MKRGRAGAALTAAALTLVPAGARAATTLPVTAGFPESLTLVPGTSTFFSSDFLNGDVYRGTLGGAAHVFLPGGTTRPSAAGIKVFGHRLFVLTAGAGALETYSVSSGRRLATFRLAHTAPVSLNDLAMAPDGDVYITDFDRPGIDRVTAAALAAGHGAIERWVRPPSSIVPDLPPGANFNGIAATPDGRYLIVDQTGNGGLYRVSLTTRQVVRIPAPPSELTGADGLALEGHTVYVACHNDAVVAIQLAANQRRVRRLHRITSPSLDLPTSVVARGDRLLVLNAGKPAGSSLDQISDLPAVAR